MFGRGFLLSTFIFAAILVSTLHATKCNNFQLKNNVKSPQNGKSEEDCSGCTGYICKVDGKTLVGSACTEDVKEICQQSWDDSNIQSIAKNKEGGYYYVDEKYFVHSCQDDNCNTVNWFKDNLVKHDKIISSAGLHQELSPREKRNTKCMHNGKEVPCDSDEKKEVCKVNGEEVPCDTLEKSAPRKKRCGKEFCNTNSKGKYVCAKTSCSVDGAQYGGDAGDDDVGAGAECVGYGIGLMVASIFAHFFLH